MSIVGDILSIVNGAESVFERLQAGLDLAATLVTSIIPILEELVGGVPSYLSGLTSTLMQVLSKAQGLMAVMNGAAWWAKDGIDVLGALLLDGASGPVAALQIGLAVLVTPVIGNLLDMGGHALLSQGFADYAEYSRQNNMPILDWCAQYRGCPSEA